MKKTLILLIILFSFNFGNSQIPKPEMILVEGGSFYMGSDESKNIDEHPNHKVSLNDFFIGKYELTINEYKGFCLSAGLYFPEGDPNMPATGITWEEAVMYCNWLSRLNKLDRCYKIIKDSKNKTISITLDKTANGYRLLSEAEWEFAASGGNLSKKKAYSGSDHAYEVAWYIKTGNALQIVGKKKANELGIYDMTGNCMEWCFDLYNETYYKTAPELNPVNEKNGIERICRGGSYIGHVGTLRITKRFYNETSFRTETLGFRLARNN